MLLVNTGDKSFFALIHFHRVIPICQVVHQEVSFELRLNTMRTFLLITRLLSCRRPIIQRQNPLRLQLARHKLRQ